MFTYKIVKHEDTENGTLFALYETADEGELDPSQNSDGKAEVVVMGQTPVNGVFYESLDELVEHITDLYNYVKQVENGEQAVVSADDVTFVEMDGGDCCGDGCDCGDDCDCNNDSADWHSFNEEEMKKSHPNMKDGKCCGGNCGCR